MTLRLIVSGGQTGVDRAALDAATELGIATGGWCPRGRLAEDGPIENRYTLRETPSSEYGERTAWNVRDSDATLILVRDAPTGGTAYTIAVAEEERKPVLIVRVGDKQAAVKIRRWLRAQSPAVLNVAGPRESTSPGIYPEARRILVEALRQR